MPASSSAEDKARILLALLTKQLTLDELETAYPDDGPDIRILYERIERAVAELYHNAAELETLNGLVVVKNGRLIFALTGCFPPAFLA